MKTSKMDMENDNTVRNAESPKLEKVICCCWYKNYFRDLNVYTEGFCQLALFSRILHYAKYK